MAAPYHRCVWFGVGVEEGLMRVHRGLKDAEADLNQKRWLGNDGLAEEGKARVDCIGQFARSQDGGSGTDSWECSGDDRVWDGDRQGAFFLLREEC